MLTLESLRAYGANVDEGMTRCLKNEAFYLMLVGKGLEDPNFDRLQRAMAANDGEEAFEAAHALKGSIGNLALTPIFEPVCQLSDALKASRKTEGMETLYRRVMEQLERARQL